MCVCVCVCFRKTGMSLGFSVGSLAMWECDRHGGSPHVCVFFFKKEDEFRV